MKQLQKYSYIIAAFIFISSCSKDEVNTDNESQSENSVTAEIFRLTNLHRQSNGLSSLEKNTTADELAADHTRYMISVNQISHDNSDQRGNSLENNENATAVAENVARYQSDAEDVMNGWLNSPGHKTNIEGNYTHIGIAAIKDAQGRYYYTQLFFRQ